MKFLEHWPVEVSGALAIYGALVSGALSIKHHFIIIIITINISEPVWPTASALLSLQKRLWFVDTVL